VDTAGYDTEDDFYFDFDFDLDFDFDFDFDFNTDGYSLIRDHQRDPRFFSQV
jgi:hypothetical protein